MNIEVVSIYSAIIIFISAPIFWILYRKSSITGLGFAFLYLLGLWGAFICLCSLRFWQYDGIKYSIILDAVLLGLGSSFIQAILSFLSMEFLEALAYKLIAFSLTYVAVIPLNMASSFFVGFHISCGHGICP